jgi:arylsulfatase A-like enzyme
MVASIVSTLKSNGEYDSTMLVFLSDNGYNFGAHRLLAKMAPYEESLRVPFAIAGPGVPHESQPALVTHEDLAPTLLDLAGAAVPDTMDGRSMRPLFEGQTTGWRSDFLAEFSGKYNPFFLYDTLDQVRWYIAAGALPVLVPTWRAVRSEQYVYIQWYGGDVHDYELYDLDADPYELTNLIATPEGQAQHAALVAQMQARLDALADCSGLSCR